MRKGWMVLVVLGLAGCASVSELRTGEPIGSWHSDASAEVTAICIADNWKADRIGLEANGAAIQREGRDVIVFSPAKGTPSEVAVATESSFGSEVKLYSQAAMDIGGRRDRRSKSIQRCLSGS